MGGVANDYQISITNYFDQEEKRIHNFQLCTLWKSISGIS
jgi:hypothetical protein